MMNPYRYFLYLRDFQYKCEDAAFRCQQKPDYLEKVRCAREYLIGFQIRCWSFWTQSMKTSFIKTVVNLRCKFQYTNETRKWSQNGHFCNGEARDTADFIVGITYPGDENMPVNDDYANESAIQYVLDFSFVAYCRWFSKIKTSAQYNDINLENSQTSDR